jgi:DnaJ-domain-containing protein 1
MDEAPHNRPPTDEAKRRTDGTFGPNNAANPGGQTKWLKAFRVALQKDTALARRTLRKVMKSDLSKDADKVAAAGVVLKYTVPLPKQTHKIEGKGGDPLALMSAEALVAFVTGKKEP